MLNYIKYCAEAYLFYQVNREDLQGKQILATNEKYYMADHGLREAVFGGNMKDINLILENIVYMELLRRGYTVTVGKSAAGRLISSGRSSTKSSMCRYAICWLPKRRFSGNLAFTLPCRTTFPNMWCRWTSLT